MYKRYIACAILLLIFLAGTACVKTAPGAPPAEAQTGPISSVQSGPPTPTPILPPDLTGDVEIQRLMLTSHTRWKTLAAATTTIAYPTTGIVADPQITTTQLWIELPARAKVISGPPQGAPVHLFISDGSSLRGDSDPIQPLPPGIAEPFEPPLTPSDTVYPHPLAGLLGTPIADLIFPAGLAQRGGEYRITGKETGVSARQAYVVEWGRESGQLIDRFWVDAQTGIILRHQSYGKQDSITPVVDMSLTNLQLDISLPPNTFDLNDPNLPALAGPEPTLDPLLPQLRILSDLDLVNVRSGPSTETPVLITLTPKQVVRIIGKNTAGDWYQVEINGQPGWIWADLVEVSGDVDAVPVVPLPE